MATAVRERAGRDVDRAMGALHRAEEKMKDKLHDESILRGSPPGSSASADAKPWGDWGGFEGEFGGHFTTAFLTFFVPTIPFLLYRACTDYDCSVVAPLQDLAAGRWTLAGLWAGIPPATPTAWAGFALFIAFQVALYFLLPGQRTMGLPTPAGNVLPYKINGMPQGHARVVYRVSCRVC